MFLKLAYIKEENMKYVNIEIKGTPIESVEELEYLGNILCHYINKYMGNGYSRLGAYDRCNNTLNVKMVLGTSYESESVERIYKEFKQIMSTGNAYLRAISATLKDRVLKEYLKEMSDKEKETLMDYVSFRAQQLRKAGMQVR